MIYIDYTMHDMVRTTYCDRCGCECRWHSKGRDENCPECGKLVNWEDEEETTNVMGLEWMPEDYTEEVRR